MRRRIALVLGLATVALAGPGMVPMASAGTNKTVYSSGFSNYVSFKAYGDDLMNCDNARDGAIAVVRWVDSRNPSVTHVSRNHGGGGTCKNALAGVNLAEGSGIVFESCMGDGTRIYACGPTGKAKA